MIATLEPSLTQDEYLQQEALSPLKHEFINGYAYAMVGTTDGHNTLALNLASALLQHLRGSGCRVYISDMKARIEATNCYYYPDIMVTCDPRDKETTLYKKHPKLIIEVLSDSTEAFDRGDKFADYRTLASLEEYVLIHTKRQQVECFRRQPDGLWVLHVYLEENFTIQSVNLINALKSLYEGVI
jgi:Uma2 family endonuclease